MHKKYHIEICQRALTNHFSSKALNVIILANTGQDHIRYQVWHPHFHFDSNAFETGYNYIEKQRQIVLASLQSGHKPKFAWEAFGRLTHSVQDFYAHTNYIQLWLAAYSNGNKPSAAEVEAMDPEIFQHPCLHSGKIYFWDWVAFIPGFYTLGLRLTPKDSHTHMNLDHPDRGALFPYALEAAVKRTIFELKQIEEKVSTSKWTHFTDC